MEINVSVLSAFFAGVASFLSPCVLPLVPVYLAQMSGVSVQAMREANRRGILFHALLFVLGFSVVFVGLGASATAIGRFFLLHQSFLLYLSGIMVILFGLFLLGLLPIPSLYQTKTVPLPRLTGYLGSFGVGFAFALGWTPCIGPILGSILLIASTQKTALEGMALLFVYSIGLGLPFLFASLFFTLFLKVSQRIRPYLIWVERGSGVLLVILGILLLTQRYSAWINRLLQFS